MSFSKQMKVIVIFFLGILTACSDSSLSADEARSILKDNQYEPVFLRLSQTPPEDQRRWICICKEEGSGSEYAVIIKSPEELIEIELGINGTKNTKEMEEKLLADGVVTKDNIDSLNLSIDINDEGEVCWYYFDKDTNKLYRYSLKGERLQL